MRYYLLTSEQNALIRLTLGIFLGALLLLALYFLLRWLSKSPLFMRRSSYMRVIDRVSLSKDSYLTLIEMAGKIFAVCVTRDGARLISSFELSEVFERPIGRHSTEDSEKGAGLNQFFSYLKHGGPPPKNESKSSEPGVFENSAGTFEAYFRSAAEPIRKPQAESSETRAFDKPRKEEPDAVDSLIDRISERKIVYFKKNKRK